MVASLLPDPCPAFPVEVIANGSAPQWVYVQVGNQAVPEPGMVSLLALTTLLAGLPPPAGLIRFRVCLLLAPGASLRKPRHAAF